MMNKRFKLIPLFLFLVACQSSADVNVTEAWVRENAPGQKVGAAYMTLNSDENSKLVYVEAPAVAKSVEIHSMSMNNGVMKMRMLDALTLKANQEAKLAPGGFHLMLFGLTEQLKSGQSIDFKLCFEDEQGNITHQNLTLPVKSR